jgi:hypothetical protein
MVLPRTKAIETAMNEAKIQRSGLTDPNSVKKIGEAINAQYVLAGNVMSLGSTNMFFASILSIEDGSQITGDSKNYRSIADGLQLMAELSKILTANVPVRGVPQRTATNSTRVAKPKDTSDFSTGRRVGAGVMNIALGLGSFTMGDWGGGLTLLAGYAVAGGLIYYELTLEYEDELAGIPGAIGLGVAGATIVYGFIRPFFYHKKTQTALINVLDRVHVAIIPDNTGIQAVGLSYTYQF